MLFWISYTVDGAANGFKYSVPDQGLQKGDSVRVVRSGLWVLVGLHRTAFYRKACNHSKDFSSAIYSWQSRWSLVPSFYLLTPGHFSTTNPLSDTLNQKRIMLSNFAIIIIVLVACLGTTALGAGVASHFAIHDSSRPVFDFPPEQRRYMPSVRIRNLSVLLRGSTPMRKTRQSEGTRTHSDSARGTILTRIS
jgi:hypothetical protein